MPPLPLSRRTHFRLGHYSQRLAGVLHALETLPDRKAPLARDSAGQFRRTIEEGRALLGLASTGQLANTLRPADFVAESVVILTHLQAQKPQRPQAVRRNRRQTYRRPSAPW